VSALIGQAERGPEAPVPWRRANHSRPEARRGDERDPLTWAKAFTAHHERLTIDEPQRRL